MGALEKEFEEIKAVHKFAVVKGMLIDYYKTIQQGQVNLPDFMRNDTPEKLAQRDIRNLVLLNDGLEKFNNTYEKAWCIVAPLLK